MSDHLTKSIDIHDQYIIKQKVEINLLKSTMHVKHEMYSQDMYVQMLIIKLYYFCAD